MLKVIPVQTKELQKELAGRCGADYCPRALCYRVTEGDLQEENDRLLGICQFLMNGEILSVRDAGEHNEDALFLLVRQVMNYLDLCSVKKAVYENRDGLSDALLQRIGFSVDGTHAEVALEGFFIEPCRHGKQH